MGFVGFFEKDINLGEMKGVGKRFLPEKVMNKEPRGLFLLFYCCSLASLRAWASWSGQEVGL